MKSANVIQPSFSAGELAPALHGRVDLARYHVGLKTCKNFMVQPTGGVTNRPGTAFVGRTQDTTLQSYLFPFQFNDTQTYALLFGNLTMRVVKDGAFVLESSVAITAATQANPVVVTAAGHGYVAGNDVYISGVVGMTQLNTRIFRVANPTANTFELLGVNGTAYTAYSSGGSVARVYTLTTPYAVADIDRLKFTQSANTMTICHPSYTPRNLTRSGHAAWTLTEETFAPTQAYPTAIALTVATAGAVKVRYKVTAMNSDGTEESLPGASNATVSVTGITKANPAVVTTGANHNLTSGDEVTMTGIVGMTELNGFPFLANVLTATTFELRYLDNTNVNSTTYGAWSSGGTLYKLFERGLTAAMSATNCVDVAWTAPSGASKFNIYKEKNGVFGFIGSASVSPFRDEGSVSPDTGDTPPSYRNPFFNGVNPSVVEYHEQRRFYANTNTKPNGIWGSQSGNYRNMNVSDPTKDDDAITRALVAKKVQDIRHLVSTNVLLALTGSAEFKIWSGGQTDVLTPATFSAKPQSYNGCSHVPPIVVNDSILYIQAKGSTIRDIEYDLSRDTYRGADISLMSSHLFKKHTIVDWAFAQEPHSIVWCVRDDGVLLGLTYLKDQEVYGWHRHETDGFVESICSISEGDEDAVYFVVKRTIGGVDTRYVERMKSRSFDTISDAWFVDCGLSYSGTATTTVTGLWHLEGETVSILADGSVEPSMVVTNGSVTLSNACTKIIVGLPYTAEMQTLRIDAQNGADSIQPKMKKIVALSVTTEESRGLKVGVNTLVEMKDRTTENWGQAIEPITDTRRIIVDPIWKEPGSIVIRQDYPLPATILSVIPEVSIGG